jgi:Fic family protein
LATLILQGNGWGFRNLLSLDSYYQRNRDQYIKALVSTLGTEFPQEYDATPWLDFFCSAVLVVARRLESHLTDWQMLVDQLHQELRPSGLLDRQIDGLLYASRKGAIARRDYVEIAAVSPLTATRDLTMLVERGYLVPEGSGRSRIYRAKARGRKEEQQPKLL